jgi:D-3-phosphoglycerate dehydrogenase
MKVLIADALSDKAVEILRSAELTVDIKTGLKGEELQAIISDYDALIVRSATKATKDIINKGTNLKIIGRAGIGVDNVDVAAATEKGIVVMNTPQGNALAAAEHSIALMFAAARKIAYADRTMKEGKWEKKTLMGMELYEKTLGVIGIGNIGSIVAEKAVALGMRVIAYDLYISKEFAHSIGVELVDFNTLLKQSDFIAIHVPLLKETRGIINKDTIAKMKRGVTIINVARGPIVVEKDLLDALNSGQVGCAALDVFDEEPPPKENPLVLSEKTICTPHLGASTKEAQDKVAIDIANQIVDYFRNGVIKNSVNAPSVTFEVAKQISPYLKLAEKLGTVVSRITEFPIKEVNIQYMGEIAAAETKILTQGIVKKYSSGTHGGG